MQNSEIFHYLFSIYFSSFPVIFLVYAKNFFLINKLALFTFVRFFSAIFPVVTDEHSGTKAYSCKQRSNFSSPPPNTVMPVMLHPTEFVSFVGNKFATKFSICSVHFQLVQFCLLYNVTRKKDNRFCLAELAQ